jgi:hypothetical protein
MLDSCSWHFSDLPILAANVGFEGKAEVARTSPNRREDGEVSGAVLAGCEAVVKVVKPHEARSEFNFSRAASASASFSVPSEASVAPSTPHVS